MQHNNTTVHTRVLYYVEFSLLHRVESRYVIRKKKYPNDDYEMMRRRQRKEHKHNDIASNLDYRFNCLDRQTVCGTIISLIKI